MRHVIETGCDGATLCAFDPSALPDDADALLEEDPMEYMERWQAEGRFWVGGTGGDGGYIFHVHVDEPLPEPEPGTTRTLEAQFERFACPSGALWLCGAEYAARDPIVGSEATPAGGLGRYPSQGGHVALPPGEHRLSIYRVERPELDDMAALRHMAKSAKPADLLAAASVVLWIVGGFASLGSALVLVVLLPIKLWQWATDNPLFEKGWHVVPITLAILAAGVAAIALGRLCDVRYRRSAAGQDKDAQRLERADYVVGVETKPAA